MSDQAVVYDPTVILRADAVHIGEHSRVDSFCKIEGGLGVHIGRYVHVASFCHIGGGGGRVVLEDHVGLASGAKIVSGTNHHSGLSMSAGSPAEWQVVVRDKTTTLKRFAFVGTNGIVMPGVTLHEGAVLGANSLATRDIPAWEIWTGNPARKLKDRPRPYELLEKLGLLRCSRCGKAYLPGYFSPSLQREICVECGATDEPVIA